jgi:hypothetical protein
MTAQIIRRIANWQEVADYIQGLRDTNAKPEMAYCATGREHFWLNAEPNYADKTYSPALTDNRLWIFIKKICPDADLAQIFYGNRGIDWHRDATYAASTAWLLSLGQSTFELETRSGKTESLQLAGGELIEFDCKCRHRAIDVHPGRIGIGIWKAKIKIPQF